MCPSDGARKPIRVGVRMGAALLAMSTCVCVQFSPFETDLPGEMRDQTAKNLAKLAARGQRPPASPERPLTLAFIADTHDGYAKWNRIVDYLNTRSDIELVVHSGDLTNHGTANEYRWAHDAFSRLNAPFFAAPGNHDGLANGPRLYRAMFGPENFVVEYAGIHFLFFNTNPNEWEHEDPDFGWLGAELARGRAARTWVVTHHPPTSPPHLTDAQSLQLWRTLSAGGADGYLYGHLHDDFAARDVLGIEFAKARSALDGSYYVITTDGSSMRLEACVIDACEPAQPAVAPGTDPPPLGVLR